MQNTLQSQIVYLLINFQEIFHPTSLLIFKKNSSLPVFSPSQMSFSPPYPVLLEPTHLLNLKKNSSLPLLEPPLVLET